jgi:hypothetical protein
VLEDLKVRALVVMQKEQKAQYLQANSTITSEETTDLSNEDKMRRKSTSLGKTYKELPGMQISMYTRYCTMESCFGDPSEEESNLAYSILQSVKKVCVANHYLVFINFT